jgi:excisionase family DNA binding protein
MAKYETKESVVGLVKYALGELEDVARQPKSEVVHLKVGDGSKDILLPVFVINDLIEVLKLRSMGKEVSVVAKEQEVTTQEAAALLGFSRPHMVKLLEEGQMEYKKVGKHRRVKLDDVLKYRESIKVKQKGYLVEMMRADEADGLYDEG